MAKVLVVYDSKSECYGNPFYARATGEAIRSFADEVNREDGQSAVSAHPEDFTLFEIGEYDAELGEVVMYESKKSLGVGTQFLRSESVPMKAVK